MANQVLNGLEIEWRSITMYNPQNYESRTLTVHVFDVLVMTLHYDMASEQTCEAVKFSGGAMPQTT